MARVAKVAAVREDHSADVDGDYCLFTFLYLQSQRRLCKQLDLWRSTIICLPLPFAVSLMVEILFPLCSDITARSHMCISSLLEP